MSSCIPVQYLRIGVSTWWITNSTPEGPGTFDRDPGLVAKTESTGATPGGSSKSTTGRAERRCNVIEIFWVACLCKGCLKLLVILCVCVLNVGRSNESESDSCPAGCLLVKAYFFFGMCGTVPCPSWMSIGRSSFFLFIILARHHLFAIQHQYTQFETNKKDKQLQIFSFILHTMWFCMRFVQICLIHTVLPV